MGNSIGHLTNGLSQRENKNNYMKNFRELVYKNPELQSKNEQEFAPEQLKISETTAREKLDKISDPDFKDFSVRYVNIEEYRHILETGELQGQVILHGQFGGDPFVKFKDKARWGLNRTNWANVSGVSLGFANNLVELIKEVEKTNKDKEREVKLEKIREGILVIIKHMQNLPYSNQNRIKDEEDKVATFLTRDVLEAIKSDFKKYIIEDRKSFVIVSREYIPMLSERFPGLHLNEEQSRILNYYLVSLNEELCFGRANIDIFFKVQNDPEYIKKPGALREIVNALAYLQDNSLTEQSRQYEIALILDDATFGFKSEKSFMSYETWGSFEGAKNIENLSDDEKRKGLLAAISIMPLKDLYGEMIDLEKGSGEFAHPVFDNKGNLKWPKENNLDSGSAAGMTN